MVSHYPDKPPSPLDATAPVDVTPRKPPSTSSHSRASTNASSSSRGNARSNGARAEAQQQISSPAAGPRRSTPEMVAPTTKPPKKKDRLQSVQETIQDSKLDPFHRTRESTRSASSYQPEADFQGIPHNSSNVLMDTVKEIHTVASGTIASLQAWANSQNDHKDIRGLTSNTSEDEFNQWSRPPPSPLMRATVDGIQRSGHDAERGVQNAVKSNHDRKIPKLIRDMVRPFTACGVEVSENLPRREEIVPHIKKMKEAVAMAVNGDMKAANEIWKFAGGNENEELQSVYTFDTYQEEENNQIRRLSSWGTAGTGGTFDTGCLSHEDGGNSVEIRPGMEDDDGNAINPLLLEKTQKSRDKRKPRRNRVVKFDYPPIRSLRQCPRPDPEDLPDLYFTEGELDQIEDDRYSTMSTDDVEIVAVASRTSDVTEPLPKKFNGYAGTPTTKKRVGIKNADNGQSNRQGLPGFRDPPEHGWKGRNRPSTPFPPQRPGSDSHPSLPRSPSGSEKRLVKGVQIYLRERSTGA